jgi:DNA-binding NarL/FixJ family response regulator
VSRILLFTDQPVLAQGLAAILSAQFDLISICERNDNLIDIVAARQPDVVLLDLQSGVTFGQLAELKNVLPNCKVVLWVHTIPTALAFQAMTLGVRGILRKTLAPALVAKCFQKVLEGELWFEKALTDSFLTAETVALTRREGQLVTLLAQGLRNKEIAATLGITETTVKVYLSRLFQKVGVQDRFELAIYGLKNLGTLQAALDWSPGKPGSADAAQVQKLRSLVLDRPRKVVSPAA